MKSITAVRGMQDFLPDVVEQWKQLEQQLIAQVKLYGYREIRFPILEKTPLFTKSIGEVTDIVEKEMYSFQIHDEALTLRPEGTASTVRVGLEHGLLHNQKQRFFYYGPMFRHERPQKGRYRQFHQFGVEAFGFPALDIEIEQLLLTWRWWKALAISEKMVLELNSIGEIAERNQYRAALVEYFNQHQDQLNDELKKRLTRNPLRLLDSKLPQMVELIENAPQIDDYLSDFSLQRLEQLTDTLKQLQIPFVINQRLVRGLDYYNQTVFEWKLTADRQQNTVCAGGRYDKLVEEMGGKATAAFGFAIGIERLVELITFKREPTKILFIATNNSALFNWSIIEQLRDLKYTVIVEEIKLNNLYKRALAVQAQNALFFEQETCIVKNLQSKKEEVVSISGLVNYFKNKQS